MAINAVTNRIYLARNPNCVGANNFVAVVDGATLATTTVPTGNNADGIAVMTLHVRSCATHSGLRSFVAQIQAWHCQLLKRFAIALLSMYGGMIFGQSPAALTTPPSDNSASPAQSEASPYKCTEPPCQKKLFDIAMKRIATHPDNAYAYFKLAQSMCPELEVVYVDRPLDFKRACPDGTAQALNKSLALAPSRGLADLVKERLERIAVSSGDTRATPAASETSSTINSAGASPQRQTRAGVLDGVYVGLSRSGNYLHVEHSFMLFSPDGLVYRDLPQDGLDGTSVAELARRQTDKALVGRYTTNGNQINIVWGDSTRASLTFDNEGAEIGGWNRYVPACRCDGARFSGVYPFEKNSILQFFPNGTFLDRGAMDQIVVPNPSFNHPRVGGGTYMIRYNTLYLNYNDGHRYKTSFAAPAVEVGTPSFRWIWVFANTLNEQGHTSRP